jgi:hypothetical protein
MLEAFWEHSNCYKVKIINVNQIWILMLTGFLKCNSEISPGVKYIYNYLIRGILFFFRCRIQCINLFI